MSDIRAVLLKAVREAGEAIVALQQTGFSVTHKANNDLLTQADLLANDILKSYLSKATPEYGWLSEESADNEARLSCDRVWVVDPIDGTKEYANRIPEYAISVALIEQGTPVLACVFNPATDELFFAEKHAGTSFNGAKVTCHERSTQRMQLLASRSEYQRGEWDWFTKHHQVDVIGSIAYKLALVAAGRAHATFSLGPKSEWDIAAGILLVTEAGGVVTDREQNQFRLNQQQVRVNGIVACAPLVREPLFQLIRQSGLMS